MHTHKTYCELLSFSDFWHNRNEFGNFNQMHDLELIKEEQRKVIEMEIRVKVLLLQFCIIVAKN